VRRNGAVTRLTHHAVRVGAALGLTALLAAPLTACVSYPGTYGSFVDPLQGGVLAEDPAAALAQAEIDLAEGRSAAAQHGFDASARGFEARNEPRLTIEALYGSTLARQKAGDIGGARHVLISALQRMIDRPYPDWYAHFMLVLADIDRARAEPEQALLACLRGVTLYRITTEPTLQNRAMLFCADLAAEQGRAELATALLNKVLGNSQDEGDPLTQAHVLARLALMLAGQDTPRASALMRLAATLYAQALDFDAALAAYRLLPRLNEPLSPFRAGLTSPPHISHREARAMFKGLDCYLRAGDIVCDRRA
jgi:tetratricopeptide (TPR) repeat protein